MPLFRVYGWVRPHVLCYGLFYQFVMSMNHPHLQYAALQQRLQRLKAGIAQKRQEAKQLFQQVMEQLRIRLGVIITEDIKEQLTHIKHLMLLNPESKRGNESEPGCKKDIQEKSSQYTLDHILRAVQLLSVSTGLQSRMIAVQLEEDIKKHIALRFAQEQVQLSADWRKHVNVLDIAEVLASEKYKPVTKAFGGAVPMLEASVAMAETAADLSRARRSAAALSEDTHAEVVPSQVKSETPGR